VQGTLDVVVQRTGDQGKGTVLFVQNNFYYDAFFLKAIGESVFDDVRCNLLSEVGLEVLNSACDNGWCSDPKGKKFHVNGVHTFFAVY
jgi:integrin alpha FG-GAP repeat containing protein 1